MISWHLLIDYQYPSALTSQHQGGIQSSRATANNRNIIYFGLNLGHLPSTSLINITIFKSYWQAKFAGIRLQASSQASFEHAQSEFGNSSQVYIEPEGQIQQPLLPETSSPCVPHIQAPH
jgi:hypothetical protein